MNSLSVAGFDAFWGQYFKVDKKYRLLQTDFISKPIPLSKQNGGPTK
jgi:hypothetical protein